MCDTLTYVRCDSDRWPVGHAAFVIAGVSLALWTLLAALVSSVL